MKLFFKENHEKFLVLDLSSLHQFLFLPWPFII